MNSSVIATVVIVGGTTALRVAYDPNVKDKPPAFIKIAVGVFALGAILTLVASGAPGVATVMGLTLVIASLIINGTAVASATGHVFGK